MIPFSLSRSAFRAVAIGAGLAIGGSVFAQFGDRNFRPGDPPQRPPSPDLEIPPAPVLTGDAALRSFSLPPNFRIELVAAEPLIHDPVMIAFDSRGRLWVAELAAYNSEIIQELPIYLDRQKPPPARPPGRVVVLEDTNGDGRMDRRTVYADNLDVPRAIGFHGDQVLISDPPNLWVTRDRDGDGVMDEKRSLDDKFGNPATVQLAPNGLVWGRDNWLYNAHYKWRWRPGADGQWRKEPMPIVGQFGIAQDDYGRLFFTRNGNQLRGNLVPADLVAAIGGASHIGVDTPVATDETAWPVRPTPGVNRGYEQNVQRETGVRSELRDDGTLMRVTAAAGLVIYRGSNFPPRFQGNAFIPEPGGNLVKRTIIVEGEGRLNAMHAYQGADFLASTDERFRPVYLTDGPDGALYVADFYRGILEGSKSITTYLRDQIIQRGLNKPLWGLGRIYRVVYDGRPLAPRPDFAGMDPAAAIKRLTDDNGWTRDTAQRQIVGGAVKDVEPALRVLLARGTKPRDRVAAVWCLEGLGVLTSKDILRAFDDVDAQVRIAAIRAAAPGLRKGRGAILLEHLALTAPKEEPSVVAHVALCLAGIESPAARAIAWSLLPRAGEDRTIADSVLLALRGKEIEILKRVQAQLLADGGVTFGARSLLETLAAHPALLKGAGVEVLAAAISNSALPQLCRLSLMRGAMSSTKGTLPEKVLVQLAETAPDAAVRRTAAGALKRIEDRRARVVKRTPASPFTPAQQALFDAGRVTYEACAVCHQPDGLGRPDLAPPLKSGYWANHTSPAAAIRIVLDGKGGGGGGFSAPMPPFVGLTNEQIAGVLTYVRRVWGNDASAVDPTEVERVRKAELGGNRAWTDRQLASISGEEYEPENYRVSGKGEGR